MELSLEKNFENKKYENNIQMMDNTKEGTNQDSHKKNSFNINEIKAYLENNNYNNDTSNDYNPHLITDISNHFSSRKELLQESLNNNEDLVMNQSYNYNPNISINSSKNPSQNLLQISQNMEENQSNFDPNYPNYLFQSEKKYFNPPQIFPDISTKKSTKTSISARDKENSFKYQNDEEYDENMNHYSNKESLNDNNNKEKIWEEKEQSIINQVEECKNEEIEKSKPIQKSNNKIRNNYLVYKKYEKKIIEKEEEENFNIEIEEDTFGKYVDNIIKRSYHVYKNRQCPSCANLLSKGKSCIKCSKYHHLIKSGKK